MVQFHGAACISSRKKKERNEIFEEDGFFGIPGENRGRAGRIGKKNSLLK